jgi:hypothetical protein
MPPAAPDEDADDEKDEDDEEDNCGDFIYEPVSFFYTAF